MFFILLKEVLRMKQILKDLKQVSKIDKILTDELQEVTQFEDDLIKLEYELNDEERLIAQLQNTCRLTILAIKQFHSTIRKVNEKNEKLSVFYKKVMSRYLDQIESNLDDISKIFHKLATDEKRDVKFLEYPEKVYNIIDKKLKELKDKSKILNL